MATITFRTDPEVDQALHELGGDERNRSDVIRAAILAANRERRHHELLEESRQLKNNPADLAAVREVMEDMEHHRAW